MRAVRSVFSDEKKLSIAALSQTLLERLIEHLVSLFDNKDFILWSVPIVESIGFTHVGREWIGLPSANDGLHNAPYRLVPGRAFGHGCKGKTVTGVQAPLPVCAATVSSDKGETVKRWNVRFDPKRTFDS